MCIIWKCKSDIIIGTDANSSMGTDSGHSGGPSGYFGLNHVNESGKCFLSYLSINNLAVVTFFKKNKYATGFTLVGKKDTEFIINKEMLHCCIDVDITSKLLASDYCDIFLELWVMRYLKRKTEPHEHILNLSNKKWSNPVIRQILYKEVMRNINYNSYFGYSDISNIARVSMHITKHKNWNKVSLGRNKYLTTTIA